MDADEYKYIDFVAGAHLQLRPNIQLKKKKKNKLVILHTSERLSEKTMKASENFHTEKIVLLSKHGENTVLFIEDLNMRVNTERMLNFFRRNEIILWGTPESLEATWMTITGVAGTPSQRAGKEQRNGSFTFWNSRLAVTAQLRYLAVAYCILGTV